MGGESELIEGMIIVVVGILVFLVSLAKLCGISLLEVSDEEWEEMMEKEALKVVAGASVYLDPNSEEYRRTRKWLDEQKRVS